MTVGAILLAGGRATRVDGANKPLFEVAGRTLLATAIAAAQAADCAPIIVVGPVLDADAPVTWVREDPPFGGPAAGIAAALASWRGADPDWTLVLACDLPYGDAAARRLMRDILLVPSDTEALCLADPAGRPQWLAGVYRTTTLREAASRLPDGGRNASMRALLDDVAIAVVSAPADETADIDTWEDLKRFTEGAAHG